MAASENSFESSLATTQLNINYTNNVLGRGTREAPPRTTEIDGVDRVYLTLSVSTLVVGGQTVSFLTAHEKNPIPSPALLERRGQAFRRAVASYAGRCAQARIYAANGAYGSQSTSRTYCYADQLPG